MTCMTWDLVRIKSNDVHPKPHTDSFLIALWGNMLGEWSFGATPALRTAGTTYAVSAIGHARNGACNGGSIWIADVKDTFYQLGFKCWQPGYEINVTKWQFHTIFVQFTGTENETFRDFTRFLQSFVRVYHSNGQVKPQPIRTTHVTQVGA